MDRVFSTSIYGHELRWQKLRALTYGRDQENEASKMFIVSWKLNQGGKYNKELSDPYFRIQTAKSTDHSAFGTWEI